MREACKRECQKILEKRSDIIAVYIIGSVARGDIHEKSDLDLIALKEQGDYEEERKSPLEIMGESSSNLNIDIGYLPLWLWDEELYHSWSDDWEVEASSIVDSIILYDSRGIIKKAKDDFITYLEDTRKRRIKNLLRRLQNYGETIWYHYVNKNYDIESVFSKLYAIEALKIQFPIKRVYLKDNKSVFQNPIILPLVRL
jgi:predicted nucleotidyltransferase